MESAVRLVFLGAMATTWMCWRVERYVGCVSQEYVSGARSQPETCAAAEFPRAASISLSPTSGSAEPG